MMMATMTPTPAPPPLESACDPNHYILPVQFNFLQGSTKMKDAFTNQTLWQNVDISVWRNKIGPPHQCFGSTRLTYRTSKTTPMVIVVLCQRTGPQQIGTGSEPLRFSSG